MHEVIYIYIHSQLLPRRTFGAAEFRKPASLSGMLHNFPRCAPNKDQITFARKQVTFFKCGIVQITEFHNIALPQ